MGLVRGWSSGRLCAGSLGLILGLAVPLSAWGQEEEPPPSKVPGFDLLGTAVLGTAATSDGVPVGGFSGLDRDPQTGEFWAISDDAGRRGPPRLYRLSLPIRAQGVGPVQVLRQVDLKNPYGVAFPRDTVDPEAIRILPDGSGFFWSSEVHLKPTDFPHIALSGRDGRLQRALQLPDRFLTSPSPGIGPYANEGFEALELADDAGNRLMLGMERPLRQDGGWLRLLEVTRHNGRRVAEYAYLPDSWTPGSVGLTELLRVGDGRYLALERSFLTLLGFYASLWLVDLRGAENIATIDSLALIPPARPVKKTHIANLARVGVALDNMEGMCWGPTLPDGRRTVVIVSDDNFRGMQETQFLVFAVQPGVLQDPLAASPKLPMSAPVAGEIPALPALPPALPGPDLPTWPPRDVNTPLLPPALPGPGLPGQPPVPPTAHLPGVGAGLPALPGPPRFQGPQGAPRALRLVVPPELAGPQPLQGPEPLPQALLLWAPPPWSGPAALSLPDRGGMSLVWNPLPPGLVGPAEWLLPAALAAGAEQTAHAAGAEGTAGTPGLHGQTVPPSLVGPPARVHPEVKGQRVPTQALGAVP
ncbi:MAG: esterase-like activity of phytase family protein [Magnetococcus sp. WYHC-3]